MINDQNRYTKVRTHGQRPFNSSHQSQTTAHSGFETHGVDGLIS